jgi:hypothetical protein
VGESFVGDEFVRVDAALVGWLFGSHNALRADIRLAQMLQLDPWPGARWLRTERDLSRAAQLGRMGLTDAELVYVLEELENGVEPYLVAAAARALRSYPTPRRAFI